MILVITVCDTLFSISKKRNNNSRTKKGGKEWRLYVRERCQALLKSKEKKALQRLAIPAQIKEQEQGGFTKLEF